MSDTTNKTLILVLGMHRSGTSAVTRGLEALDVSLGDNLIPPFKGHNDKGYWEDSDINKLNIEMLQHLGKHWTTLLPLSAEDVEALKLNGYFERAIDLLEGKIADANVFAFKDPRTTLLLPFWNDVIHDLNCNNSYLLVVRNPKSVVESLMKRGVDKEIGYYIWLVYIFESLLGTGKGNRVIVDYDDVMVNAKSTFLRIAHAFNLNFQPEEFSEYEKIFLDDNLRHTHFKSSDLINDDSCPSLVRSMYELLRNAITNNCELDESEFCKRMSEYKALKPTLGLLERIQAPLRNEIAKFDAWVNEQSKAISEMQSVIGAYTRDIDFLKESLSSSLHENAALTQEVSNLRVEVSRNETLTQEVSNLRAEVSRLSFVIERMVNSVSWRVTSPFRKLCRRV